MATIHRTSEQHDPSFNWIRAVILAKSELNKIGSIYGEEIAGLVNLQRATAQTTSLCIKNSMVQQANEADLSAQNCNWAIAGSSLGLALVAVGMVLPMLYKGLGTNPEYFKKLEEEVSPQNVREYAIPTNEAELDTLLQDPDIKQQSKIRFKRDADTAHKIDECLQAIDTKIGAIDKNDPNAEELEKNLKHIKAQVSNPTLRNPSDVPVTPEQVEAQRKQVKRDSKYKPSFWDDPDPRPTYFKDATPEALDAFKQINNERQAFYTRRNEWWQNAGKALLITMQTDCASLTLTGVGQAVTSAGKISVMQARQEIDTQQADSSLGENMYNSSVSGSLENLKNLIQQMDSMQHDFSFVQTIVA